jgi:hypothetical protein
MPQSVGGSQTAATDTTFHTPTTDCHISITTDRQTLNITLFALDAVSVRQQRQCHHPSTSCLSYCGSRRPGPRGAGQEEGPECRPYTLHCRVHDRAGCRVQSRRKSATCVRGRGACAAETMQLYSAVSTVQCSAVQCSAVQYLMCSAVQILQSSSVQCSMQCSAVQGSAVSTKKCSEVQYLQFSVVQCSAVQWPQWPELHEPLAVRPKGSSCTNPGRST